LNNSKISYFSSSFLTEKVTTAPLSDTLNVTDFFEVAFFESLYPNIKECARKGMIPERVETSILDIEVDLCMMEHDVDFSVRRAPDLIRKCKLESNLEV